MTGKSRGRIVLLHCVAQMPLAGIAWQAIHHLVGLRRLGFDVWYVEDNGAPPYDPRADGVVADCSFGVAFLRAALEEHGFVGRWAYWDGVADQWHGLSRERVRTLYAEADILLNLCGVTRLREEHLACPVRLYIDTDPIYEQVRYATGDLAARTYLDAHTNHATYGAAIGTPWLNLDIDTAPLRWRATRPPVVRSLWPETPTIPIVHPFTTVATWENRGKSIAYDGQVYHWSKHVNFLRFLDLPRRTGASFTLAMRAPTPEVEQRLRAQGWALTPPLPVSANLSAYAGFIAGSGAEFTVAKDIYVRPNSGWMSDRSVCYLACGRPVITQRTGAALYCPMGEGVLDFADPAEAAEAVLEVARDYPRHSAAARRIAAGIFDSDSVLSTLLAPL